MEIKPVKKEDIILIAIVTFSILWVLAFKIGIFG